MAEPAMTGMFNEPMDLLADVISESTAFQTWFGAANAAAAKALINFYEIDDGEISRPLCLIDTIMAEGTGPSPAFQMIQGFLIMFEVAVDSEFQGSTRQAVKDHMNNAGPVMEFVLKTEDRLRLKGGWEKIHGPARSDKRERAGGKDYVQTMFLVKAN